MTLLQKIANYVAERVRFNPRIGVAAAALLGMLAVPSVGKAESPDLISMFNGKRCLETTTLTLYVAEGVNDCNCEDRGFKESVLEGVVQTLQGKGYQIKKGGTIKAPEEPYLGQTPDAKSAGAKVIVIPHKEDGKCKYALVSVEDSDGNIVVSDQIYVVNPTGQPLLVSHLKIQLYNLFPTSCPILRKLAEEERKKAGPQPELRSRCEGENDTPSYTPSPKDAKAGNTGSLEREVSCLRNYALREYVCHGGRLPDELKDTLNQKPGTLSWEGTYPAERTQTCLYSAGRILSDCLERAKNK